MILNALREKSTAYHHSLDKKSSRFYELLAQAGCPELKPKIVPTPIENGFRTRAKFKLYPQPEGLRLMGTDPILGETEAEKMMWILPDWGRDKVHQIYAILDECSDTYPVDGFETRFTHGDNKSHVCLSVKRSFTSSFAPPAQNLLNAVPGLIGVAVPSLKEEFGSIFLEHKFSGLNIFAHYAAFFQSNLYLLPELLLYAAAQPASRSNTRIIDLYCGVGLFSLFIGNRQNEIIGVDFNKHAIVGAIKNAARLGFSKTNFLCQPVERFILHADIKPEDLVFINPSRSGCPKTVISGVASRAPETICVISCDPDSFIRDLADWLRFGYSVLCSRAFDMFPFTDFLETIFVLKRR